MHPLGFGSPYFRTLPLTEHGLTWINPEGAYVHAFSPDRALLVERNLEATANNLGPGGSNFVRLMTQMLPDWDELCDLLLHPAKMVFHPIPLAIFGSRALLSARAMADHYLQTEESKAVFAGVAAHSSLKLDAPGSASIGLSLAIAAHAVGWPIPQGGAQSLSDSLIRVFLSRGGELVLGSPVRSLADLPSCRFIFFDLTPSQFVKIADKELPESYKARMQSFRYGPSCFKMDWALSGQIPWLAPEFLKAPTVHLAGTFDDIARSEQLVWEGVPSKLPYVLLSQPSLFDRRSPTATSVVWAYCHVPYGSTCDASDFIESQIERFAPGFRKLILARSITDPKTMEEMNENHVGGDINGGTLSLSQLLTRPIPRLIPYKTPLPNVYLCSSSTPPGSGVHGMCGYYAASVALNHGTRQQMAIQNQKRNDRSAIPQIPIEGF